MPDTVAEVPKVRRTTFIAFTVGEVRFCMLTIEVAARMVIGERVDGLQEVERQETRDVKDVLSVAVIDVREEQAEDILVFIVFFCARVSEYVTSLEVASYIGAGNEDAPVVEYISFPTPAVHSVGQSLSMTPRRHADRLNRDLDRNVFQEMTS